MFSSALALAIDFTGSHSGPSGEVAKPSEGLKGPLLVIIVVNDFGSNIVVLAGGSKGVVVPLVEPVLVSGFCHYASGTLDRAGGGIKGLVIGRAFVDRFAKWVMETAGQTDVVLLRPGRGEAGYTDAERTAGEVEPRGSKCRPEGRWTIIFIVLGLRSVDRPEGVAVDSLAFEIGFVRGERIVGDPGIGGGREGEPRYLRDI